MIIPEIIRIGSCDYNVVFTDNTLLNNHQECYALIDHNKHIIEINNNLGDFQQQELSFLHELFHGIFLDRSIEVEDEELIVEELARGFHQIIRDNPFIFLDKEYLEDEENTTEKEIEHK